VEFHIEDDPDPRDIELLVDRALVLCETDSDAAGWLGLQAHLCLPCDRGQRHLQTQVREQPNWAATSAMRYPANARSMMIRRSRGVSLAFGCGPWGPPVCGWL